METKLLYLKDFSRLECDAKVTGIIRQNDVFALTMRSHGKCKEEVILDQTVFYPQSGGQPYDVGIIESPVGKFIVEEVRVADGIVRHIGYFEGDAATWKRGFQVVCQVDAARRMLHSRIHSVGHLVDWAIAELRPAWMPDPRGYHYPNGPYVTYAGSLEGKDKEKLKTEIEAVCNRRIKMGEKVSVRFMSRDEMKKVSRSVPDLPSGKSGRVIMFGDNFGVACGGTHVRNLSEIHGLMIRKIKQESQNVRIGYNVITQ